MLESKALNPECQIVVFNWKYESDLENLTLSQLSESTAHDVSNYIKDVSFSKQLSSPAGSFQITLENDRDWKQYIKKGSWVLIYMSNTGGLRIPNPGENTITLDTNLKGDNINIVSLTNQKSKLRCIGYIDTVRVQSTVGEEKGDLDVVYHVMGRDFGIVYEETDIWHNRINFDEMLLKTANANINSAQIKTVDKLLETLHQLMFSPQDLVNKDLQNKSLTSLALQWLLPSSLLAALGVTPNGGVPFFGNIPGLLNFESTVASFPIESPLGDLNGIAWDQLKRYSISSYHELFPELVNGLPQLYFRPIPWLIGTGAKFPKVAKNITKFKNLERVELATIDILDFDLGEDNHTRYNLFWSNINSSLVSQQTSDVLLGDRDPKTGFPRIKQNSISRHGLRMMYLETNANLVLGEKADSDLLRQYNEVTLEYWEDVHNMESGNVDIVGNNDIRLGKVLHFDKEAPYNADKYFYIEGYSDTYTVDEKGSGTWTQNIMITRGIEKADLDAGTKPGKRRSVYKNAGNFTSK